MLTSGTAFKIPSLRRALHEPPRPVLVHGHDDLLTMVDVGPAGDPVDGLADNIERVLEVVEPILILLSLCGREAIRMAIAAQDTLDAVSVTLDESVRITGLERAQWPSPITFGLINDPVVVAFELSSRPGTIRRPASTMDGSSSVSPERRGRSSSSSFSPTSNRRSLRLVTTFSTMSPRSWARCRSPISWR